jgi:alanyl-tRNA synthetase
MKLKLALGGAGRAVSSPAEEARDVAGIKLIARRVEGLEKNALRGLSDSLRDRLGSGVVVLASDNDGRVSLVVSVTKDLLGRVQAGRLVKELAPIVGGGGGGRPDFAEAGGKDPSRIDDLLGRAPDILFAQLQN